MTKEKMDKNEEQILLLKLLFIDSLNRTEYPYLYPAALAILFGISVLSIFSPNR